MQVWEILLLALAVSMDACAVAMTDGMCDAKMSVKRTLLVGVFFGAFQMLMPIIGYFVAALVANAFLQTFEKISAWVSFALLAFLGGKMLVESIMEISVLVSYHPANAITVNKTVLMICATRVAQLLRSQRKRRLSPLFADVNFQKR